MGRYIMSLDQGTTSSRCILFDKKGKTKGEAALEFTQYYPKPGWVEHDPLEIWDSICASAKEVLKKTKVKAADIAAIGITNQRETTVIWDKKTGKPIYNAIVWQCRRTAPLVEELSGKQKQYIKEVTGLVADAYFSATKIKWILDNVKGARKKAEEGRLLFGTIDTWLLYKLTGGKVHATDLTNASRTMLFDIRKLKWDKKLLKMFDIPEVMMPDVHPSGWDYGRTDDHLFGADIPICSLAGDQQASLFGLGGTEKGDIKNTYGTGCFLLMNTKKKMVDSPNGLLTTIACGFDEDVDYILEGSVFMGGATIQWLRDGLKLIKKAKDSEQYALKTPDTTGAYLVPAFTGLGAPYWEPDARGILVGVTRGFEKEHMIRAALEAIAYQVHDVVHVMEKDSKIKIKKLTVDGGAAENGFLMQFQSDVLNRNIVRSKRLESTAFGTAAIAGIVCGFWNDTSELRELIETDREFTPGIDEEKRKQLLSGWDKAVKTALYWTK